MRIEFLCTIFIFLVNTNVVFSQQQNLLKEKLKDKNTLSEVLEIYDQYYKDPETIQRLGQSKINRNYKRLKRWEWFMSSRLGPNGEFVNINQKLIEATGIQQERQLHTNAQERNMAMSSSGDWSIIGPLNTPSGIGRVDRLAFHPTNANTIYAGAAGGGLWRTTNAGTSWTNLTPDIPNLGVSGIAINPDNTNTLYILTGDGDSNSAGGGIVEGFGYMRLCIGVLKSTNGGSTWSQTGVFTGADYSNLLAYRLTMHPTNPLVLFACTNQGLYRTEDGGDTWILVDDRGVFYNLKFKPDSATDCYAVSRDGGTNRFLKSTDGGIIFTENATINNQISNPTDRVDLAVAQSNSNIVYILAGGIPAAGQYAGLFRSSNSGTTFSSPQSTTPNILGNTNNGLDNTNQAWYDLALAVSNTTSNTVIAAAVFPWSSTNAGVNWTFRGNLHADIHELGFHPVDNKLWAATDGGVYSSIDNGNTWTSHFEGMSISQFYRMNINPDNFEEMLAGAQDNGVKRRSNGTSFFDQINGADGFTVEYDAADTSVYYAIVNQGLVRFTNSGANANAITPIGAQLPFAATLATHPSLGNTAYIGAASFWRSANATNGNNWVVNNQVSGGWALRTCPSNGNRIYMAGGASFSANTGVLRRSDDAGVTWVIADTLSERPGFPATFPKITYINVNPTNSSRVWVTFGGYSEGVKVFSSTNAGESWQDRSGSLPNLPVNCIAIDNNNNAYVGTDNGIFYRAANMSDWVPFYNNLPYIPVTDLVISQADNKIRASTFGRGIWESELYSPCEENLNIAGTLKGQEFHEASQDILSSATLFNSEGTKVQMRAGNEVLLQAGFTAQEKTQFRAAIGPCGSGGVAGFRITPESNVLMTPNQYLPPSDGRKITVHVKSGSQGLINFDVNQTQNGDVNVILTNKSGSIIKSKDFESLTKSQWSDSFTTKGLNEDIYYLYVLLNDTVHHMQEVLIHQLDVNKEHTWEFSAPE
jgi:hypothetical protein